MAKVLDVYGIPRGPCIIESIKISGVEINPFAPIRLQPGQRLVIKTTSEVAPIEVHLEDA